MPSASLLVIGDRTGLSWILESNRMAFAKASSAMRTLAPDDQLFIYTTRKCFKNPSKNASRVIGRATVTSSVAELSTPMTISGRTFFYACAIHVDSLTPFGEGVELRKFVDKLDVFSKSPQAWNLRLRRTLVPLPEHDASIIANRLAEISRPPQEVIESYLKWLPQEPNDLALAKRRDAS